MKTPVDKKIAENTAHWSLTSVHSKIETELCDDTMSRLVRVIALAPAGTPKAITEALNLEIRRIANSEEFKPVLERNSLVANQLTPADTRERVKRDYAYWSALVKQLGIRPD